MNCYLYAVFRETGIICYIGKGSGNRWKRHDSRARRNSHYAAILSKANGDLPVVIFKESLNAKVAYIYEEIFIRAVGLERDGGPLINQGYGGEGGPNGVIHSKEWKEHRSKMAIEVWKRPTYRAKMMDISRYRGHGNQQPRSAKFKQIMSNRLKGNKHTLGFKHSIKSRHKMSEARKGKKKPDNFGDKIRLALTGVKHTEERKRNMVAGQERVREMKQAICLDLMCGAL